MIKAGLVAVAAMVLLCGCATDDSGEDVPDLPGMGGAGEAGLLAPEVPNEAPLSSEYDEDEEEEERKEAARRAPPEEPGEDPLPPGAAVGDEGQPVDDRGVTADGPEGPAQPEAFPRDLEEARGAQESDAEELGDGERLYPENHSVREGETP